MKKITMLSIFLLYSKVLFSGFGDVAVELCDAMGRLNMDECELCVESLGNIFEYKKNFYKEEINKMQKKGLFENFDFDVKQYLEELISILYLSGNAQDAFALRDLIFKCCLRRNDFLEIDDILFKAVSEDKLSIVEVLDSTCLVEVTKAFFFGDESVDNGYSWHSLHVAVSKRAYRVAEFLIRKVLEKFEHINLLDANKNTPLHIAALVGDKQIVTLLLKYGANPLLKNKQDETARDKSIQCGYEEISSILSSYEKNEFLEKSNTVRQEGLARQERLDRLIDLRSLRDRSYLRELFWS